MFYCNRIFSLSFSLAAAAAFSLLTACSTFPSTTSSTTSDVPKPATPSPQGAVTQPINESNVSEMAELIIQIKDQIQMGEYDTAKATFEKIGKTWESTKGGVQTHNQPAFNAITVHLENIKKGLEKSPPNAANLLSDLTLLETVVYRLSQ